MKNSTIVLALILVLAVRGLAQDSRPISSEKENWPPERTLTALRGLVERGFSPQVVLAWSGPVGSGSLGFGELPNGEPVAENSVFEIGSVTKVFTALLLAVAVEDEKVALGTTIGEVLGEELALPERTAAITLAELASHRAGLPRLPGNLIIADAERPYEDYGSGELCEELMTGTVAGERGSYLYSNYGGGLLGWLLGRIYGSDFATALSEKVLKPLGLESTAMEPAAAWTARTVSGHNGQVPVPLWRFDALAGAGDLVASAGDLARFLAAALQADPETTLGRAFRALEKPLGETPDGMKVGLGWHILQDEELGLVWHNGGTGGFSSFAGYDRASGRSLVILSSSNAPEITGVGINAFRLALPTGLEDLPVPAARDRTTLAEFEGRYRLPASLVIEIRLKGDHLGAQVAGQSWYTLYPAEAKDAFFLVVAGIRVRFLRSDEGEIVGLEWSQQGEESQATRMEELPPFVKLAPSSLKRLEGRYELGADLVLDVRADAGRLSVRIGDQPRIDVYPVSERDFVYKVVDARLTFVADAEGRITALRLHQNGMTQEAPRLP